MKGRLLLGLLLVALVCALLPSASFAQSAHTVSANWSASTDDTLIACAAPSVCSQNIYRAPQACSANPVFAKVASLSATAVSFTDSSPLFGNSCYVVTFVINGVESVNSNASGGSLRPSSPTTLGTLYN